MGVFHIVVALVFFTGSALAADFTLASPELAKNKAFTQKQVFKGFGCTGENISPGLTWKNPPEGTQSFALTVYDPDAPTGSGWWHWVLLNIPKEARSLPEGAGSDTRKLPAGVVQSLTDYGVPGYGGPCPPAGDKPHRYIFKLYALNVPALDLKTQTMPALAGFMINSTKIGEASFEIKYGR